MIVKIQTQILLLQLELLLFFVQVRTKHKIQDIYCYIKQTIKTLLSIKSIEVCYTDHKREKNLILQLKLCQRNRRSYHIQCKLPNVPSVIFVL